MKFGLLYELQYAKPWPPGFEARLFHEALEQIALADRLGYDYVWEVEHHFLQEYSHSSAPEVLLAAASQRTERIRLGHGVVLLPSAYNHPIRVAERIATLDIVSGGRVEFGTGRSGTPLELGGFGIDPATSKEQWDEALRMIPRMWTEDPFSHEGRFYSIPPRSVIPKPVQRPHPPIWVAASTPATFQQAGERGIGVLCFIIGQPAQLSERIDVYRQSIRSATPVGAFVNEQVAGFTVTLCLEDACEARAVGGTAALWYAAMLGSILGEWRGKTIPGYEYYGDIGRAAAQQAGSDLDGLIEDGTFCIGDPAACIRTIEKYEAAGVDQLICLVQAGRIPHETIMHSLELFAREVMPRFRTPAPA